MPTNRIHTREKLDNLDFKGRRLTRTLDALSKINVWFGNSKYTLEAVKTQIALGEVKTIVDLGCGGGDNLIKIAKWLRSQQKEVKLIGIDGNNNTLEYAKAKEKSRIEFLQADILDPTFQLPKCDLLISSHFVYHFKDDDFVKFLERSRNRVSKAIILSELRRSLIARILFYPIALFFSEIVRSDGLKAIQRSFTRNELTRLIKRAGFVKYSVKNRLVFRLLAVIETDS